MTKYFQDYMQGQACFGCGTGNHQGLQIKSYWQGDQAICIWHSQEKYNGWKNILNGGILATIIDCHCMNTAMAAAYKAENRELGTAPFYGYATGKLSISYFKPTANDKAIELRATVREIKGKKVVLHCDVFSEGIKTAEAEVIAIKVIDSSQNQETAFS